MKLMNIVEQVSLRDYSTMRLGGPAAYLTEVHSREELVEAVRWAEMKGVETLMIGGGSNIVWRDEGFDGLILVNKMLRFESFAEDDENYYFTVGAGEPWDSVVERTVQAGATGIEALSLIPGTAGATPVQNVGAYGQEIADTLVSVEAYDTQMKQFINIPAADCAFGYRTSRFKNSDHGRFYITAITLHLFRGNPAPPFYASVQQYLDEHPVAAVTSSTVREAVIAIRTAKLPDPKLIANNGSFFANPVVDRGTFAQLSADFGELPHWPAPDGHIKLSAAWLIEHAGFKGYKDTETGMATWQNQPLVLVNESAKSTADLIAFVKKIVTAVKDTFDVNLAIEPELLP